jgi:hypothetical protein
LLAFGEENIVFFKESFFLTEIESNIPISGLNQWFAPADRRTQNILSVQIRVNPCPNIFINGH